MGGGASEGRGAAATATTRSAPPAAEMVGGGAHHARHGALEGIHPILGGQNLVDHGESKAGGGHLALGLVRGQLGGRQALGALGGVGAVEGDVFAVGHLLKRVVRKGVGGLVVKVAGVVEGADEALLLGQDPLGGDDHVADRAGGVDACGRVGAHAHTASRPLLWARACPGEAVGPGAHRPQCQRR